MNLEEKILTLNLNGKKGVNISKSKYYLMKNAVISVLTERGEITLTDLNNKLENDLSDSFDGRIGWYLMSVKLDLEVRGSLERVPGRSPQTLRLRAGGDSLRGRLTL
jgi:hypothetical protein